MRSDYLITSKPWVMKKNMGSTDRIIRVFLDDAPRQIAALEEAAVMPNLEALREHAHSLKSASASFDWLSVL